MNTQRGDAEDSEEIYDYLCVLCASVVSFRLFTWVCGGVLSIVLLYSA
jgi:hypothetical protein